MAGVQYKAETGKLDYIDALRGIAALSVFFYHVHGTMWIFTGIMPLQMIPNKYIQLNMASVPLFFIISSFTLYLSLDNKFDEKRKSLKFYIRRFFRIAPLFYVLLILVVLEAFIIQNRFPSWLEVLANFTFVFNLAPQYSQSLFSDGWTVGVEMIFYLFLPLIFIKVNNIRKALLFFIGIILLSKAYLPAMGMIIGEEVINNVEFNYNFYNLSHWASIFSIGIVCYLIYKSYLPMIKSEYGVSASLYMLSLFIFILFGLIRNPEFPDLPWPLGVGLIMYGVAFSLLIFSLSLFPNQLIVNRITRFYGMISFSFYLVHPFLVELLKPVYNYIYTHTILSTDLSFCLCLLLTLLIVTPISLLTYHLIETPGMRYGKRIIAKL